MQRSSRLLSVAAAIAVFAGLGAARADEPSAELAEYDKLIDAEARQHWSYLPVEPPQVPAVENADWCRNPIDRFILARLEQKGWRPAAEASREALLRRAFLDANGIPPTIAEQDAFLADSRPEAFERLVDDLLARPAHGERWGRHWLDLVRYAETNGYERDAEKPHVWRFRDYVIDALNDDLPFDRFILEQLAGDELADRTARSLIATGYFRLGPWDDEPAEPEQDRFDQLDDMVATTSQVFLGMTLACARCHNHKFEALTAHDYYRMVAVFNPLSRPANGRTELDSPVGTREEVGRLYERDRRLEQLSRQIASMQADKQPAELTEETRQNIANLGAEMAKLRESTPDLPRGYFMQETSALAPATHLLLRGRAASPGPEVQPGIPAVLSIEQPKFPAADDFTSRRRLTLARWIASEQNPLTARVIVNRVWQYHFGEGIVRTPSDFGVMGQPPTHPELLDWLACWFVHDADWSLKELHRLILTSSTYRMAKTWNADFAADDPTNDLLWRFPRRRLEVEAIRDTMLAASGELNRQMHGPGVYLHVPKEALEGSSDPDKIWKPFEEGPGARRSVYAFVKRSLVVPMLEVLDLCDTTRSSEQRSVTNVAPQALTLFNGQFVTQQAARLADRLEREAGDELPAQIQLAYRLVLCRRPTSEETKELAEFVEAEEAKRMGQSVAGARAFAMRQTCRVILNLNEVVYPD